MQPIQLSANTVMRRIEVMTSDVILHFSKIWRAVIIFHSSLTTLHTLLILLKLMKVIPLHGRTTGQVIYSQLQNLISYEKIPVSKLVGLITDGASAMIGDQK
ncbi:hypothetical protein PR048_004891 [Dryococelus australis]|uniref:DUF4371 domain-containing protein n=1 Tax=Dryococelus australis TaxID=614101 RepID=A0ABQ9I7K2_9NEOP|nr:hypothetical protein PR048_004891 [Dryococelus australis]